MIKSCVIPFHGRPEIRTIMVASDEGSESALLQASMEAFGLSEGKVIEKESFCDQREVKGKVVFFVCLQVEIKHDIP